MNFNLDALIHLYPLLPPTLEEAVLLLLLELSAETLEIIPQNAIIQSATIALLDWLST